MTPESVAFHVGLPKTGTTYLQKLLWHNRAALAKTGLRYPGAWPGAHWHAALDLRRATSPDVAGAWQSLVDDVMSDASPALISHEMFAGLRSGEAAQVVEAVHPRQLHLVITLRDLSRIVPATWQERAKNREIEPWPQFIDAVGRGPDGGHPFWRLQDAPAVLKLWSELVPPEQIRVVTVPPPGAAADMLLQRFAAAVGFDPAVCTTTPGHANESIGALEVALLQHINAAATDRMNNNGYRKAIKRYLVPDLLATRPHQRRVALSTGNREWVEEYTSTVKATVRSLGCEVFGDLDDLDPAALVEVEDTRTTTRPETVSQDDVLHASAELAVVLAQEVVTLREKLSRAKRAAPPRRLSLAESRLRRTAATWYRGLRGEHRR